MASAAIMEEKPMRSIPKQGMLQHWKENGPKIWFSGHELYFDLSIDDLDEFFIQKAKEELRETPENVALGYKEFGELVAEEPDLRVPTDEEFYIIFLRPCKWYAKSAFSLMKHYYRFRQNYPHIFTDLLPSKQKSGLCSGLMYPLPLRTKEGCRILIMEWGKRWKPKEVSLDDLFKALLFLLVISTAEAKTQIAGAHIILDVEGMSLTQVSYITPSFAKMMIHFVQRCSAARIKGIHIVNQSFIFNIGFAIFKPFLEEKLRNRMFFHGTNWESLMTSTLTDKSMLVTKYGGELEMPKEPYGVALWQGLLSCEPAFELEERCGYQTVNK